MTTANEPTRLKTGSKSGQIDDKLSIALANYRKRTHMTQGLLAQFIGVHTNTIRAAEHHEPLTEDIRARIKQYLAEAPANRPIRRVPNRPPNVYLTQKLLTWARITNQPRDSVEAVRALKDAYDRAKSEEGLASIPPYPARSRERLDPGDPRRLPPQHEGGNMTTERTHRTKEGWDAIQAAQTTQPVRGHSGSVLVTIDGAQWQAPSFAELQAQGYEVDIRYVRRYPGAKRRKREAEAFKAFKAELRKAGLTTVHIKAPPPREPMPEPSLHGGHVYVTLMDTAARRFGRGKSHCVWPDVFNKDKGYVLAVNRALEDLQR